MLMESMSGTLLTTRLCGMLPQLTWSSSSLGIIRREHRMPLLACKPRYGHQVIAHSHSRIKRNFMQKGGKNVR